MLYMVIDGRAEILFQKKRGRKYVE